MQKAMTCMLILIVCLSITALQAIDYESLSVEELTTLSLNGDADAQCELGWKYFIGGLVKQNYNEAYKWYLLSAEQGHVKAQYNLGSMYYYDEYGMQNYRETRKWWLMAAEQGNEHAQYNLGVMYSVGHGVIQDMETAYLWFSIAVANATQESLETYITIREMVAKELTSNQREKIKKQAREWMRDRGFE